jgi:hypothetical protein
MKIGDFFFSFFASINQYFPHIPYVAARKKAWSKKFLCGEIVVVNHLNHLIQSPGIIFPRI